MWCYLIADYTCTSNEWLVYSVINYMEINQFWHDIWTEMSKKKAKKGWSVKNAENE